MMTHLLLLSHAATTWTLVGLIWTVQTVHYPLFAAVPATGFVAYERAHVARMTALVAPVMGIELLLALALALGARPGGLAATVLAWSGAVLVLGIWTSTALVQAPLHRSLESGFDAAVHRRLLASNWVRTSAWTLRGGIAAGLLAVT